jgi:Ca2+-binding RTX toxin-like protein
MKRFITATVGVVMVGAMLLIAGNVGAASNDPCDQRVTLEGTPADDELIGTNGKDKIKGHQGDDSLFGGEGNDCLIGNAGDDYLNGGPAVDTCDGGGGYDVCHDCETAINCEIVF